ncbi:MAG: PP2C family protein-serine/threonine phosphatase [Ignavibacteriales bacterium]|nr:PP2C family protein-serine/threonine phosphatase [Ignavibacteriales bacterium]
MPVKKRSSRISTPTSSYVRRLESLIEASKKLNTTLDLDELLKVILNLATKNLGADRGTIYLIDEEKKELWSRVLKGKELVEIRLPIGTGISGYVAETGKTVNLEDAWRDKRFFSGFDVRTGYVTKTMLCMPMRNRENKIIGVFQIINKKTGVFDTEDEQFLAAFSDHVALAIENAYLLQARVEKERVEREIQIAAEIQNKLIPKELPPIHGYQIDASAIPCKTIGGDYYDVVPIDDDSYVLVVADVSGKGIPAALLVSTLNAALHAYIQTSISLSDLVQKLNQIVYKNTPSERYITFFISILNTRRHQLMYVNAGHNFPYKVRKGDGEFERLTAGGLPLGMFEQAEYKSETIDIQPDDLLVFYSDGVTEAMDKKYEEYGENRFRDCILAHAGKTIGELKGSIFDDIQKFVGSEPQSDDLTLMLAKRVE